jgi:5-methylcytosine-specific restriction endonuclease McrA
MQTLASFMMKNSSLDLNTIRPKNLKKYLIKLLGKEAFVCEKCGYKKLLWNVTIHHKIPIEIGGDNTWDNLMFLCRNCHAEAHFLMSLGEQSENDSM